MAGTLFQHQFEFAVSSNHLVSMKHQISCDPKVNCVFMRHLEFADGGGRAAIKDAVEHPAFKIGMNALRDTRDISLGENLKFNWFKEMRAENLKGTFKFLEGSKFSWVVNPGPDFTKAHHWALVNRSPGRENRRVFTDIADAFEWLGLPPNYQIDYGRKVYSGE